MNKNKMVPENMLNWFFDSPRGLYFQLLVLKASEFEKGFLSNQFFF